MKSEDRVAMYRFALAALLSLSALGAAGGVPAPADSLRQLRFSPDGRYILAQDSSEFTVLSVQPLAVLFRIPAENASNAHFTPDSRQIVFVSSPMQVDSRRIVFSNSAAHMERWSVTDHAPVSFTGIPWHACGTQELSPDGRVLACVDFEGTLQVIDVGSAQEIMEKKRFAQLVGLYDYRLDAPLPTGFIGALGSARIDFSPDGRFLIADPSDGHGSAVVYDLHESSMVRFAGELKHLKKRPVYFAFIAPDRLVMSLPWWAKHGFASEVVSARLVTFPSGKLLSEVRIPMDPVFRAADPGFILVRPFGRFSRDDDPNPRAAAVELSTGRVIISDTPALDAFGRYYVAEHLKGEVGLYEIGKGLKASVAIGKKSAGTGSAAIPHD